MATNNTIPTFILKLWKLVNDKATDKLISWSRNNTSFTIKDQASFAKEVLPLYFKHNNMASFIRQLNMYGFRKVSNIDSGGLKFEGDEIEFYHQHFHRDHEDQLAFIKRKLSNNNSNTNTTSIVKLDQYHNILSDVESMKDRQESVDSLLNNMKRENEALWREVAILRQKHLKQQQIVEKLLHFLVNIVRNQVVNTGIKRKAPLMIDSSTNRKILKPNLDSVGIDNGSPGPIISDITDLEESDLGLLDFDLMKSNDQETENVLPIEMQNEIPNDLQTDLQHGLENDFQNGLENELQNEMQSNIQSDSDQLLNNQAAILNTTTEIVPSNSLVPVVSADQVPILSTDSLVPVSYDPSGISDEALLAGFDAENPGTSTDLILPNQTSAITSVLNKLSPESFNNHVDGIDEELNWLYDQLNETDVKFDPNLFG